VLACIYPLPQGKRRIQLKDMQTAATTALIVGSRAPLLHEEIVAPDTAIRSGRHAKQESLIKQPVSLIEWLAREVEQS